jgi:hypothetical protein
MGDKLDTVLPVAPYDSFIGISTDQYNNKNFGIFGPYYNEWIKLVQAETQIPNRISLR